MSAAVWACARLTPCLASRIIILTVVTGTYSKLLLKNIIKIKAYISNGIGTILIMMIDTFRSPAKCNSMGVSRLINEPSPSSSEESNSPTELNCYRRLGDRQPLMKRLAMGLSGALLQPSDDDSTPLVTDTPTT